MKYIDVSEHQGVIDWEKVKGHVDGVMIRAGYGQNNIDKRFKPNASECNRLGIPCGAYWFSYARTVQMAEAEAKFLLAAVKPFRMELPLSFDYEYDSVKNANKYGISITKELATKMVYAFCEAVEKAGYWCLNYANPDFLAKYFSAEVPMRFGLWLAAWPKNVDVKNPPRACAIWQWGSSEIPGITPGKGVDTNEAYTDFKTLIAANGMNNLGYDDGEGGVIYEHAQPQTKPADTAETALKWAKEHNITEDPALALAIYRYHAAFGPEDNKKGSGLLSD